MRARRKTVAQVHVLRMTLLIVATMLHILEAMENASSVTEPLFGDIFYESRSYSLHYINSQKTRAHKCQREVPARFFQTTKDASVRGNGSTIYFNRIEVCCAGYTQSRHDAQQCVPDCSAISPDNCRNGFCRAPNQCECFDEFVRNDRGQCVHTCPIACEHGRCYLNGTCECQRGYALDPQTRKFCRPDCGTQMCGTHQECVAPRKCACKDGYKLTPDLGCQPVCTPDCGHGKCVGPNQCECFEGYIKRPQRNVCEAECYMNCENGFCEARFQCQCRAGYKYDADTTSCLPDCGDVCENGVCIAPGVCKCYDGYELTEAATCEPMCLGGCGYYGKCLEPNICGCQLSNQLCIFGSCVPEGRCTCPTGLTRFIDKCVDGLQLEIMVSTYEQRYHYNVNLQREWEVLIGRWFQFTT